MNYSSLNNKYSFSEVNYKIKEKYRTLVWRRYLISGLMIITFAIFTFLITQEFGFIIFGFIMIFFAITYLSIYFYIKSLRSLRLEQFSLDNHFTYSFSDDTLYETGHFLSWGVMTVCDRRDIIEGEVSGTKFSIFNFVKYPQHGYDNPQLEGVLAISFHSAIPDVYLQSKKKRFVWRVVLNDGYADEQSYDFEGDMHNYYKAYISRNSRVESLDLLDPYLLQEIKPYAKTFDIEIRNHKIYLYPRKAWKYKPQELQQIFTIINKLSKIINRKLITPVNKEIVVATSEKLTRINTGKWVYILAVMVALFILAIWVFGTILLANQ